MDNLTIFLVSLVVVLIVGSGLYLLNIKDNRDACHARGGIFLDYQCFKGELL